MSYYSKDKKISTLDLIDDKAIDWAKALFCGRTKKRISVQFILKRRTADWGQPGYTHKSSGLHNSATYVSDMLKKNGVDSELVEVIDNNCIDRAVTNSDPDIVVIEAVWVTPEKLRELTSLRRHRHRKWIIRNHSELTFLSMEGIALQWFLEYSSIKNVYISNNSPVANYEVGILANLHTKVCPRNVLLLPNHYPTGRPSYHRDSNKTFLDISCFGAIRPLKNHMEQAVAAIIFSQRVGKPLRFHINATRVEGRAEPILKSLRAAFAGLKDVRLVEHSWLERDAFLRLCHQMDLGLQVSFSETFNIVAADHVIEGVPCVTSSEVPWMPKRYTADPTSAAGIADVIANTYNDGVSRQVTALRRYSDTAKDIWLHTLKELNK